MTSKLTNLLSRERIRALQREYYLRLLTVSLAALGLLFIMHSVLLLPSFIYAKQQVGTYRANLVRFEEAASLPGSTSIAERLRVLDEQSERVLSLASRPSGSEAVRSVLAVPRAGVTLSRFTITAPKTADAEGIMTVSGIAHNRESLREYHVALMQLSFVAHAELPLGAYAYEEDIPFTITLKTTPL